MAAYTFRLNDERLNQALEIESRRRGVSVADLVLETLQVTFLGPDDERFGRDGFDRIAGSWSLKEAAEFDEAVRVFAEIDPELWQD